MPCTFLLHGSTDISLIKPSVSIIQLNKDTHVVFSLYTDKKDVGLYHIKKYFIEMSSTTSRPFTTCPHLTPFDGVNDPQTIECHHITSCQCTLLFLVKITFE